MQSPDFALLTLFVHTLFVHTLFGLMAGDEMPIPREGEDFAGHHKTVDTLLKDLHVAVVAVVATGVALCMVHNHTPHEMTFCSVP